ncbi:hypothetical protein A6M21_04235 [Desulfotomaculum copahuensis]|uniref:DUF5714 domain-containing protein n=1 Tax=Desulfotomaculum copahuensis TaxID=1838280 RepID=A0A1B7LIB4_9FIRM|nr:hypothetical protein A6M21_04235 [Desulfotomaculum copahuensis]
MQYLSRSVEVACTSCGKKEPGYVVCPQGHYICDQCHGMRLFEQIFTQSLAYEQDRDPLVIAQKLLSAIPLPMLGCEHALVAAAALMTALKNDGFVNAGAAQVREAMQRTARQAVGAFCGLTGICGVVVGIGASFSVILGAACPKDWETALTMRAVAVVIDAIAARTGPCCCKAFIYTGLETAAALLKDYLQIKLPAESGAVVCRDSRRHPHGCRREICPFYERGAESTV